MSKIRLLFVLFSFLALAAPAGAQRKDHGRDRDARRGSVLNRDQNRNNDNNQENRDVNDNNADNNNQDNRDVNDDNGDNDDNNDEDGNFNNDHRNGCIDNNGNDVCGAVNGSVSSRLPEMVNAILISPGQLTRTARSWLGAGRFTPQFTRSNRNKPSQVTWLDGKGSVRQVWLDKNGDGRADIVRLYRSGKLVRTVRR